MQQRLLDRKYGDETIVFLSQQIKIFADAHSKTKGVNFTVDANIVEQAFTSACSSVEFHKETNYKREVAHIAFWLAQLKPVACEVPKSLIQIFGKAAFQVITRYAGGKAVIEKFESRIEREQIKFVEAATFAINETVAVQLVGILLSSRIDTEIKKSPAASRETFAQQHRQFHSIFFDPTVFVEAVQGLRYHIFTPRSFATFIETVFAFAGCPVEIA